MALLTVTQVTLAGATDVLGAASAGGDLFANDGRVWLEVLNSSGAPITLTLITPALVQGIAVADPTVVVPAAGRRKIGPFPSDVFNAADGTVSITYSGVTTLTVGAFRL